MQQSSLLKKLLFIAAAVSSLTAQAQNITNPDFEIYSQCPSGQTQISRATGWSRPTGGTSDYFNNCGYNISTTVSPHSGNAFAGGYMEIKYTYFYTKLFAYRKLYFIL